MQKVPINVGYGSTLGNMIDGLAGRQPAPKGEMAALELERVPSFSPLAKYTIAGDNITHPDKEAWIQAATALGIIQMDDEVENLDQRSDAWSCFEISEKVRWKDVTIDLGEMRVDAPSVERICEAVQHMVFNAWCPGDI